MGGCSSCHTGNGGGDRRVFDWDKLDEGKGTPELTRKNVKDLHALFTYLRKKEKVAELEIILWTNSIDSDHGVIFKEFKHIVESMSSKQSSLSKDTLNAQQSTSSEVDHVDKPPAHSSKHHHHHEHKAHLQPSLPHADDGAKSVSAENVAPTSKESTTTAHATFLPVVIDKVRAASSISGQKLLALGGLEIAKKSSKDTQDAQLSTSSEVDHVDKPPAHSSKQHHQEYKAPAYSSKQHHQEYKAPAYSSKQHHQEYKAPAHNSSKQHHQEYKAHLQLPALPHADDGEKSVSSNDSTTTGKFFSVVADKVRAVSSRSGQKLLTLRGLDVANKSSDAGLEGGENRNKNSMNILSRESKSCYGDDYDNKSMLNVFTYCAKKLRKRKFPGNVTFADSTFKTYDEESLEKQGTKLHSVTKTEISQGHLHCTPDKNAVSTTTTTPAATNDATSSCLDTNTNRVDVIWNFFSPEGGSTSLDHQQGGALRRSSITSRRGSACFRYASVEGSSSKCLDGITFREHTDAVIVAISEFVEALNNKDEVDFLHQIQMCRDHHLSLHGLVTKSHYRMMLESFDNALVELLGHFYKFNYRKSTVLFLTRIYYHMTREYPENEIE